VDVGNRPFQAIELEELRRRIARFESGRQCGSRAAASSGCAMLDRVLPMQGFRPGSLVEWLSLGNGTGACTLALLAAREVCRHGAKLVVIDGHREFCPPAAVRLGIELEQLLIVHVDNAADHDWAMDQALRSSAVAAVLAWPTNVSGRTFRRWQLAAEVGGCLGLLLRPEAARVEPSWADVRLLVEPVPAELPSRHRRLQIALLRCRGGTAGHTVDVELDDETYRMYPAGQRAKPTVGRALLAV
jgi:protein ImuA